jgi:hypothetical protein
MATNVYIYAISPAAHAGSWWIDGYLGGPGEYNGDYRMDWTLPFSPNDRSPQEVAQIFANDAIPFFAINDLIYNGPQYIPVIWPGRNYDVQLNNLQSVGPNLATYAGFLYDASDHSSSIGYNYTIWIATRDWVSVYLSGRDVVGQLAYQCARITLMGMDWQAPFLSGSFTVPDPVAPVVATSKAPPEQQRQPRSKTPPDWVLQRMAKASTGG